MSGAPSTPAEVALRDALVASGWRRQRRRAVVQRAARSFAIAVLAAVVSVAVVFGGTPAAASTVEVRPVDGFVEVAVVDPSASAARVLADLRDAGVRVTVERVPASPSRIGRPVYLYLDAQHSGAVGTDPWTVRVPADRPLELTVGVGRRALPWERYDVMASSFDRGEPLACAAEGMVDGAELARLASRRGLEVRWRVLPGGEVDASAAAGLRVLQVSTAGPRQLDALVTEAGRPQLGAGCEPS